jgi:hypothetical protein
MMNICDTKPRRHPRALLVGLLGVALGLGMAATTSALAAPVDRVTRTDGTVVVGRIVSETRELIVIEVTVDGRTERRFIRVADVRSVERNVEDTRPTEPPKPADPGTPPPADPPAAPPAPPSQPAPEQPATRLGAPAAQPGGAPAASEDRRPFPERMASMPLTGRPARVAILNFGMPSNDRTFRRTGEVRGEMQDTVGTYITAKYFNETIPLLERANVDAVVIRINSGGGMLLEMTRLQEFFVEQLKPRFRTVGWVEWAGSAAAMAPWVLSEFYMMTNGAIGGNVGFSGGGVAMRGLSLEGVLHMMEKASAEAGRSFRLMRSMQMQEPLTINFNPDGSVTFLNDMTGEVVLNRAALREGEANRVLTMTTDQAVLTGFAQGVADTIPELMRAMGYQEYEIVALDATELVNNRMRETQRLEERLNEMRARYQLALQDAMQQPDRTRRMADLGRAASLLNELERAVAMNPNLGLMSGMTPEWFEQQREIIRRLREQR